MDESICQQQKEPPHRGDSFADNQRLPVFHH